MRRLMQDEILEAQRAGEAIGEARGKSIGEAKGEMKAKKETAITLAGMGMPAEKIAEAVKVSLKIVQEWLTGSVSLAR